MSIDEAHAGAHPEAQAHDASLYLPDIVLQLRHVRERWRAAQGRPREASGRELPSRESLAEIVAGLRGALFPMRLGPPDLRQDNEDYYVGHTLDAALHALLVQVRLELGHQARARAEAGQHLSLIHI